MTNRAMAIAIAQRINNRALYVSMCKGDVSQRSIRSQHGTGKRNRGIVMGNGQSYHGAIDISN